MSWQESLYLRAIYQQPVERTPLWIMRQAGRYLPEYRALRSGRSFLDMCQTPELACEVTLQPIRRFGFDAAILFSDILVIPAALGQTLTFMPDHGPRLQPVIQTVEDVQHLQIEGLVDRLDYVAQAVRLIRRELPASVPLIGFSGSPWTLAVYMVEGQGSKSFSRIKKLLYSQPQCLKALLDVLEQAVISYLRMQVHNGVQTVQIFDSWGGILPPHWFMEYSAASMHRIAEALSDTGVPVVPFSRVGLSGLQQLSQGSGAMLGVDWSCDWKQVLDVTQGKSLQGNMDPTVLLGNQESIEREVERILLLQGPRSGHVFNLGHGILPETPLKNVHYLVDAVREISSRIHGGR